MMMTSVSRILSGFLVVVLASVTVAGAAASDCCEEYCYSRDDDPYIYFGTKTAYEFVHGGSEAPLAPYCSPVQVWMIVRHGASLPNKQTLERFEKLQNLRNDILDNYEKYGSHPAKGGLCYQDLTALRKWYWNSSITYENEYILSEQGANDLRYLAQRFKKTYPGLLQSNDIEDYLFRHTENNRGQQSFKAFAQGWFDYYVDRVKAVSNENDSLIQPHKFCNQWKFEKSQIKEESEYKNYLRGDEFRKLIGDVSTRLGFKTNLNESMILDMYDACRYEKSWYVNRLSAWCTVFTKDQLQTLEFIQDLFYYSESGYGNKLNRDLGCPLIKDMIERFGRVSSGSVHEPKAIVYFTPTTTLFQVLVSLGINEDANPLRVSDEKRSRIWKTSQMNPFGANFAAVLYKCDQGDRFRISFMLNEKNIKYPEYLSGLISWFDFRKKFQQAFSTCNVDELCKNSGFRQLANFFATILTIAVLRFVF